MTWFYCLMVGSPIPRTPRSRRIGDLKLMPKAFQDHDCGLWIPYHHHCAELLARLVADTLAPLRTRAEWLRQNVEEPARTAVRRQAERATGSELDLLRAEKGSTTRRSTWTI